jgi:mono/diheme cytochrome c family protein
MKQRRWQAIILTAFALTALAGCRRGVRPQPGDPLLDAIRAEERDASLTYVESQGRRLFLHYCATCHGDDGAGQGQNASNLNPPPPDLTASNVSRDAGVLRRAIAEGSAAVGRSALSPPWGRSLSRQQIDSLVAYCQILSRKKP